MYGEWQSEIEICEQWNNKYEYYQHKNKDIKIDIEESTNIREESRLLTIA